MHINKSKGTIVYFTGQSQGDFSDIQDNYQSVLRRVELLQPQIGLKRDRLSALRPMNIMLAQDHTSHVEFVEGHNGHLHKKTDGLIWRGPGSAVFFPADCAGVVFRDVENNLTGLLHASNKTLASFERINSRRLIPRVNIIEQFLELWQKHGGDPKTTEIMIGPSICQKCLDYDEKWWQKKLAGVFGEVPPDAIKNVNGRWQVSIEQIIVHQLRQAGYAQDITRSSQCTKHGPKRFWSARRHGKERNAMIVVALPHT